MFNLTPHPDFSGLSEETVQGIDMEMLPSLVEGWLRRERNGERFPVDFDAVWEVIGYATKASAKRKLKRFKKNVDFSTPKLKSSGGGRSSEVILLTCDAFKHFCLLAETDQGDAIRQYFIECEKRWNLVQQHHPEVAVEIDAKAQEMEMLRLKNQNLALEAQIKKTDLEILKFRHTVTSTCPEIVQQKVLGYQLVEKTEYRDRIINDGKVINDGNSVGKGELCRRYGFLTKSGSPDYKRLNAYLQSADLPAEAWKEVGYVRNNEELDRAYLPQLDRIIFDKSDRQLWLVE